MKQRTLLFILSICACFAMLDACGTDRTVWQGFQGTPTHGLHTYGAGLRTSDIRDGTELRTGILYISHGRLRYEMQGSGPLEHMILLARLDSGQAWLVNPAGNSYLEGSFAPQRWMDIEYLLAAFPKVTHPRIISANEELLGGEILNGYKVIKVRRTGRAILFGEEREFTEVFWLAEESCIPLRHENNTVRTDLTNIHKKTLEDTLFALPAECRKVSSIVELLQ